MKFIEDELELDIQSLRKKDNTTYKKAERFSCTSDLKMQQDDILVKTFQ